MVYLIRLLETKPNISPEKLEDLMIEIRIRLLRLPEVANLRVGKRIGPDQNRFKLFYAMELENMERLRYAQESAIHLQLEMQILQPVLESDQTFYYEMEPGKDVRFS